VREGRGLAYTRAELAAGGLGEETMGKEDMMPVAVDQATLWTLNADRQTVRLVLPPLPLADLPPINVKLDFDAAAVDAMLERLSIRAARCSLHANGSRTCAVARGRDKGVQPSPHP
jgi:hypothetical protein